MAGSTPNLPSRLPHPFNPLSPQSVLVRKGGGYVSLKEFLKRQFRTFYDGLAE
jgi:hypothetical protein